MSTLLMQSKIRLGRISAADLLAQGEPLFKLHQQESEPEPPRRIAPLANAYLNLERAGNLIAFAAWDGEKLIGYVTMIVTPHLHYTDLVANHDLLFVLAEYRPRGAGLLLMRLAEEAAKNAGAVEVAWRAKPKTVLADLLEARRGYEPEELVFRRRIA